MWIVIFLLALALLAGVVVILGSGRRRIQGDPDLGRRRGEGRP
jgi:hypothetical protein